MSYGKTIELFLANGTANSLVTAELSNWNGKAIKIPRTEVLDCKRDDLSGIGIYFLLCQNDDGTDSVYIGEAEIILERLKKHMADYKSGKETYYWNTAVAFIGRDLNKALIRYLENRFFEIAKQCGRCHILTKATFKNTVLKESQIASMEEFIENTQLLMSALGYNILVPVPQATETTTYLYCKSPKSNANAKGYVSSGGFTVLSGSRISDYTVPSMETHAKGQLRLRNALEQNGQIANGVFTVDYEFPSPSTASAIVLGKPSSGNADWKTIDGIKLKDL